MLDTFEILTTSGVVLWSKTYSPVNPSVINNFIADTFIEEKSGSAAIRDGQSAATNPPYKSDQHTVKWTMVKELGIIFVVCARSLAPPFPSDCWRTYAVIPINQNQTTLYPLLPLRSRKNDGRFQLTFWRKLFAV